MKLSTRILALTAAIFMVAVVASGCDFHDSPAETTATAEDESFFGEVRYPEPSPLTASSAHFSLNTQQLNAYRHLIASNALHTQYLYLQYGLLSDENGILSAYATANAYATAALPYVLNDPALDASVRNSAKEILALCELAHSAGAYDTLKVQAAQKAADYLSKHKATAESLRYDYSVYLANSFNASTTEADITLAMEQYYVAMDYYAQHSQELASGFNSNELAAYAETHKADFYTTDYTYYMPSPDGQSAELKAVLASCTSVREVKIAVLKYLVDLHFDEQYEARILHNADIDVEIDVPVEKDQTKADVLTTLLVANALAEEGTEAVFDDVYESVYDKAAYGICLYLKTSISPELNRIRMTSAAWSDPTANDATEQTKWLFHEDRRAGDTTILSSGSNAGETFTWYIVGENVMVKDTNETRDVCYYVFSGSLLSEGTQSDAHAEAAEFYAKLQAAPVPETFALLSEPPVIHVQMSPITFDAATGTLAVTIPDSLTLLTIPASTVLSIEDATAYSEQFAEWMTDPARMQGDIVSIDTEKAVIVALYNAATPTVWEGTAASMMAQEAMSELVTTAYTTYSVSVA